MLCIVGVLGWNRASAQEAGTYYIQNVGTGKWLGPGNNWGTQASVLSHADYWKLAKINDGVYTLESVVSNGGTSYYLTGTFCDGAATNFTFAPVSGTTDTYTIANADGKYLTTNGTTVDVSGTDATAANAQWKLWSEADMAAGMTAATVDNPFDATYLIKDHDLGRNNRDYSAWSNTGATAPKSNAGGGSAVFSVEAYHAVFDVNQTLSNVPNGVYALRVNGFCRQDGSAALPSLYANEETGPLPDRGTGSENDMQSAAVSFVAGKYLSEPVYVQVTDGTLKIGVKTEGNSCWVIFKNFHLAYYGDVTVAEVVLSSAVKAYNDALAAAQAYQSVDMFDADKTALNTVVSENTLDLGGSVTEEQLQTAAANLNAAAAAASLAASKYAVYVEAKARITGQTNVNLTDLIVNAGFETGTMEGWTSVDGGAQANNRNFGMMSGDHFVERWRNGAALESGSLTHDAVCLPKGIYTITAEAQNIEQYNNNVGGTGYFLCANEERVEIGASGTYSTSVMLEEGEELTIKFLLENCTGNWICCDNVTLTFVGEDFPAYTLVTGKMNAKVDAEQTAADNAFQANQTIENYNALTAAIQAAQASVDAYTAAGEAIEAAKELLANHNFASADAIQTFAAAISAVEPTYNDNTMTTAEAQGVNGSLGTRVTGWHAGANGAAAMYLSDGFGLNAFDAALYINTWSNEGEWDGSNFKVPFYEYFADNGSILPENTWTGTLTGLENGLYSVSVWVRVRTQNEETAVADLHGISMNVNNGTAVDVTEGDQVGTSRFQLKEYTAEGLVKDGVLKLNVNIAADNNIHWLSFKNVKYEKVRDLTPDEEAVVPTAIALYNGEEAVTGAIVLNETTMSVTLTPKYEPTEATEGVVWSTSDENVATVVDGVVTAVLPGTATITASSTLDSNVKAEATIVVTFPESTVPAQVVKNEGATRIIATMGENLIKNGSFEYPTNPYYGWTYGTGSTTAITSEKFDIITEGAADGNQYLKAKTNEGGAAAGSLNTSWQIEPGKTYVFGYNIKATGESTGNQYIGTSLNTTKGQENSGMKFAGPAYNANEWTSVEYVFESGEYTWLVFNARWLANNISFDNFYLAEVTTTTEGNVQYALDAIPAANIGDGVFQIPQTAIDAANALEQGVATVADVEAAYNALTTVNAPADGQLFNVILTYGGWTYDQKAMTYMAGDRSDMGGYNIKYNAPANQNLAQAFTFTKVDGNNYKMSQIDADGNVRYMTTGVPYGGNTSQIRTSTNADDAMLVTVIPTATEGVWNLKNVAANNYIGSQDAGVYTVNSHIDFNIVETTKPAIAINTTAAGWGTTILPFAAEIPENVKAYSCDAAEGNLLTLTEVSAIEANKPYIIEGAWEATLTGDALGITLTYTDGWLTGVYAEQKATPGTYVLQKKNKVCFYQVDEGEGQQPTVGANRAYLQVSNSDVKAFFFNADDATGINGVFNALHDGESEVFNAAGARQNGLQKGLNIIRMKDGSIKKVMVK